MSGQSDSSILLRNQQGGSDKEYLFSIYESDWYTVHKFSGPTGNCTVSQGTVNVSGFQGRNELAGFITSKLKKGYRIISVNKKPFMGGSASDAVNMMCDGFSASSQTPIGVKPPREEVPIAEFDEGDVAPVW